MTGLLQALAGLIIGLSAGYFFGMVALGVRASHRAKAALRAQAEVRYEQPAADEGLPGGDPCATERYHLYYLVPCLNEELVIGATVSFLAEGSPDATVIVVDDASDDRTGATARAAGGERTVVVRRELPEARLGKGPALNAGFTKLLELVRARRQDPDRVIVVVMDADGRLSRGALTVVLPLFDDPAVGGAQLAVRIRNRSSWITCFQDFQFWTMSAMTQFGRIASSSVSLGGNGQFTRLSALLDVGEQPWQPSLTEDLDLAISLMTRGWQLTTTPHASVDQQGVESGRRLLNQRTRWYQGHMTAGRRIPEIWRSSKIGHNTALEAVLYLLVPWVLDMPWSILYHLALASMALRFTSQGLPGGPHPILGGVLVYLAAFYPALATAYLCRRRDPHLSRFHCLLLGHSFVLMNYLSWACCWRGLYRMVRGRVGWEKTARAVEAGAPAIEPLPHIPVPALPRPALPRPALPLPALPLPVLAGAGLAGLPAAPGLALSRLVLPRPSFAGLPPAPGRWVLPAARGDSAPFALFGGGDRITRPPSGGAALATSADAPAPWVASWAGSGRSSPPAGARAHRARRGARRPAGRRRGPGGGSPVFAPLRGAGTTRSRRGERSRVERARPPPSGPR